MKHTAANRCAAVLLLLALMVSVTSCDRARYPDTPAAADPASKSPPSATPAAPPLPPPALSASPASRPAAEPEGFSSMELREGSLFFHSGWLEALRVSRGRDQGGSADIMVDLLGGSGGVAYTIDGRNKYRSLESAYLADLDGDGQPELVLMFATHGTGGMGTHGLQVLKYDGKGIVSMPMPGGDEYTHMGDVTITLLPQYMARLESLRTGFTETVFLPETAGPECPDPRYGLYNEDGSLRESASMEHADCVYQIGFTPHDGAWALTTRQYVWLYTHVNGIGDWVSTNILQDGQWVCVQEGLEWYGQP